MAAVISSFRTTSDGLKILAVLFLLNGCASSQGDRPRVSEGSISYPFVAATRPIGRTAEKQPFVIRSAVGGSEYTVEIPDDASRYDIQIPLAELSPKREGDALSGTSRDGKPLNAATTDKELVANLPDLAKVKPGETAMMDSAFGVGSPEGPVQSPSYTIGIAKVNQHYREKNFELALVELNNLLAFYPNSPKLLKMKGTLLIKTGNRELAMKSWQRAYDLAPTDPALKRFIDRLNERIIAEQRSREGAPKGDASSTIKPIEPNPNHSLEAVGH